MAFQSHCDCCEHFFSYVEFRWVKSQNQYVNYWKFSKFGIQEKLWIKYVRYHWDVRRNNREISKLGGSKAIYSTIKCPYTLEHVFLMYLLRSVIRCRICKNTPDLILSHYLACFVFLFCPVHENSMNKESSFLM